MKRFLMILFFAGFCLTAIAQTAEEFLQQSKTQKKYLLQQITALNMYIGYLQKGYSIAKTGLNTISQIKAGEFNLHDEVFNSLKKVNPLLSKSAKVFSIMAINVQIKRNYYHYFRQVRECNQFNSSEIKYISHVYDRLMSDCFSIIEDLIKVITDDKVEMKDDERLKQIDELHKGMEEKYVFVKSFSSGNVLLARAREKEKNDIKISRLLNDVKN